MSIRFVVICTLFSPWISCIWSQPAVGAIPSWVTNSTAQLTVEEQPEEKDDPKDNPFIFPVIFEPTTQHIEKTTTTSLPESHSPSESNNTSPSNASDSGSTGVDDAVLSPKPTVTVTTSTIDPKTARVASRKRKMERQNKLRCNKLLKGVQRLRNACRSITHEALANTEYAYVMSNNTDVDGMKRDLVNQGLRRSLDTTPILPGLQNENDIGCPIRTQWMAGANPNEHSLSPWAYKQHYDPNRIPQMMSVAKCLCEGCIDPDLEGEFIENKNFVSKEITRYLRVLRRDATAGKSYSDPKSWQESLEEIAIGCHCMRPRIL